MNYLCNIQDSDDFFHVIVNRIQMCSRMRRTTSTTRWPLTSWLQPRRTRHSPLLRWAWSCFTCLPVSISLYVSVSLTLCLSFCLTFFSLYQSLPLCLFFSLFKPTKVNWSYCISFYLLVGSISFFLPLFLPSLLETSLWSSLSQVNLETNECMEFISPRKVRRRTLDFGGGGDDVTATSESDGALLNPGARGRNVAILDLDKPPQENRHGGKALKKTKGKKGNEKVKSSWRGIVQNAMVVGRGKVGVLLQWIL